mmetsp:Transcript_83846/g.211155  ORF Transcript_83846/g.211155 Transcript_83846/m.211155 type:complete len:287 (+) Transcript_83846:3-863(+)
MAGLANMRLPCPQTSPASPKHHPFPCTAALRKWRRQGLRNRGRKCSRQPHCRAPAKESLLRRRGAGSPERGAQSHGHGEGGDADDDEQGHGPHLHGHGDRTPPRRVEVLRRHRRRIPYHGDDALAWLLLLALLLLELHEAGELLHLGLKPTSLLLPRGCNSFVSSLAAPVLLDLRAQRLALPLRGQGRPELLECLPLLLLLPTCLSAQLGEHGVAALHVPLHLGDAGQYVLHLGSYLAQLLALSLQPLPDGTRCGVRLPRPGVHFLCLRCECLPQFVQCRLRILRP